MGSTHISLHYKRAYCIILKVTNTVFGGNEDMERRGCPRIKISADGVFYLGDKQIHVREFTGIVDDISESGLKIRLTEPVSEELLQNLSIGKEVRFQIVDEFELMGELKDDIISGAATIMRTEQSDSKYCIGCKFNAPSAELLYYVTDRKTYSFLQIINNR